MKFVAITILAFIAAVCASPVSISDNNVGDIVSVLVNAKADISNEINQDIINVLLAYLNQQAIVIAPGRGGPAETEAQPSPVDTFAQMFLKN